VHKTLKDETETVILDATADAFIASRTTAADDTMDGEGTDAGPLRLLKRIARLIGGDDQLAA